MRSVQSSSNSRRPRRGIIVILAAVGLLVLLATTILSVDTAYIQLTRTELRVATDAAAKAAAEALMRTQDTAQAVAAAKSMASLNRWLASRCRLRPVMWCSATQLSLVPESGRFRETWLRTTRSR